MNRRAALLLFLCGCATAGPKSTGMAGVNRISSPGGDVHFEVRLVDGRPEYRVLHGGAAVAGEVLAWSPLGVTRDDADFGGGLAFVSETSRAVTEEYELRRGKRSRYANRGVERVLAFRTAAGGRLELEVRVFD